MSVGSISASEAGIHSTETWPEFVSIERWLLLSGMTRSGTYEALRRGNLVAIKQPGGRRTLIDATGGLAWLRAQPRVQFGPPRG
jgi:hypothetical protein